MDSGVYFGSGISVGLSAGASFGVTVYEGEAEGNSVTLADANYGRLSVTAGADGEGFASISAGVGAGISSEQVTTNTYSFGDLVNDVLGSDCD